MRVAVLLPVLDDADSLARVLGALEEKAAEVGELTAIVVDDGSESPIRRDALPSPTAQFRMILARHAVNLGQGAALETARRIALAEASHDAYITMDSDGQHGAEDAVSLARAIQNGADVAFGNRFLGDSNVPASRRALLRAARWLEWSLTGLRLADAHNGLRGFSRRGLESICIRQNRMAHATEITQHVSRRISSSGALALKVVEVPVSVRYTAESLGRGQRSLGALAILRDLLVFYLFGET